MDHSANGYRYRTTEFWLVLVLGTVAAFTCIDFVFGYARMISTVRVSAQQFRSEAARMSIRTRNLVPDTNHIYHLPYRGDLGTNISPGAPRIFRTDLNGTRCFYG
mgnify:CR=1 FL=1